MLKDEMKRGRIPESIPSVGELIGTGVDQNNPGRSQSELAREIGFAKNQASMLSIIKNGSSRLKLGRVARAASVLKLNPVILLASVLKERTENEPEAWDLIRDVLNATHDANEEKILSAIREVEEELGHRVKMTPEKDARLKEFVRTQLFVD